MLIYQASAAILTFNAIEEVPDDECGHYSTIRPSEGRRNEMRHTSRWTALRKSVPLVKGYSLILRGNYKRGNMSDIRRRTHGVNSEEDSQTRRTLSVVTYSLC
jgi:hypothetical protein